MQQKVHTFIQNHQLLTYDKPIIVGVSGGTDSVALLHILISLGYDCIIAHCNFHLRMEESIRDEEFVRTLADNYKSPFYSIDFKTIEYADEQGISIEMAARDLRYEWFYQLLEKCDAQAIAVAHHADDSIETMLMNLTRGTGLRGLTGIPVRNNKVLRPLLCCTRKELENYLVEHELNHIEDSSNAENDYLRNKFRNEVIPLLTEINPTVRENIYKTIGNLSGNLAIYQHAIEEIEKLVVDKKEDIIYMNIELIKQQADVPTVLYELLHPYGFSAMLIEQIAERLDAESGKVFYSNSHRLIKDRKHLIISAKDGNEQKSFFISQHEKCINSPIDLKINQHTISSDFSPSKTKKCIHVDADRLVFPLELRRWNEGDWFYPFGMNNKKKVSDYFIDQKLSLAQKEQCWLLVSGNEIVWIVGQRMDNRFRITEKTREVVEFNVK